MKLRKVVAEVRDPKIQGRDDILGNNVTVELLADEWVKHNSHWKEGHRISVKKRAQKAGSSLHWARIDRSANPPL